MFFKLLRYDLKEGILREYKKYLLFFFIFIVFCFDLTYKFSLLPIEAESSYFDYVLYAFGGMKPYDPAGSDPFPFPIIWLAIHLLIGYFTLYYPYNDLMTVGQNILIRSGGRRSWWLSKCLWNMLSVVCCFALAWGAILLFCLAAGVPITNTIFPELLYSIFEIDDNVPALTGAFWIPLFVLPLLVSLALNLLEMTLSLFLKPLFSFGVYAVVLLSSAYLFTPYMIGNFAMPIRSHMILSNGMTSRMGIMIAGVLIVLCIAVGSIYFKRYDILNNDE